MSSLNRKMEKTELHAQCDAEDLEHNIRRKKNSAGMTFSFYFQLVQPVSHCEHKPHMKVNLIC